VHLYINVQVYVGMCVSVCRSGYYSLINHVMHVCECVCKSMSAHGGTCFAEKANSTFESLMRRMRYSTRMPPKRIRPNYGLQNCYLAYSIAHRPVTSISL